mmetsp:Transcript_28830/g.80541  ORF Transcript_28830/g.80541 Transcript_28830/m.80541 type:complete len:223 (-) Transcript_28830:26-694(-)
MRRASSSVYESRAPGRTLQPRLSGAPGARRATTSRKLPAGTGTSPYRRPGPLTTSAFSSTAWPFPRNVSASERTAGKHFATASSSLKSSLRCLPPCRAHAMRKASKERSLTRAGGCAMIGTSSPAPPLESRRPIRMSPSIAVTRGSSSAALSSFQLLTAWAQVCSAGGNGRNTHGAAFGAASPPSATLALALLPAPTTELFTTPWSIEILFSSRWTTPSQLT